MVDGYNVINAWSAYFGKKTCSLKDKRDKLLHLLSDYQGFKGICVVVVFDAHLVKGGKINTEEYDNIRVVYTKENISADVYIERFVYTSSPNDIVRVVTSDYLEQRTALFGGGARMTPDELWKEIEFYKRNAIDNSSLRLHKLRASSNSISENLKDEVYNKLENIRKGIYHK